MRCRLEAGIGKGHRSRVPIAARRWGLPAHKCVQRLGARQTLVSPLALDPLINIEATIPSGSMPQYPT
jgi:hypothetical protein